MADEVASSEPTRGTSSARASAVSDSVWLNDRKLVSLPESAFTSHTSDLRALSCESNFINELPLFLGRFCGLHSLLLANNSFTSLPHQHLQFLGVRLSRLTMLDISCNGLTYLPLEGFTSLVTLKLDHNRLLELPHTLSRMSRLTELYASHNQLQALPDNLPQELSVLQADDNDFCELPADFLRRGNLTVLSLSNNSRLELAPQTFLRASRLKTLRLADTGLWIRSRAKIVETSLPASLSFSVSLLQADFSGLDLPGIPLRLFSLTSLVELRLARNRITTLPVEVSQLHRLVLFDLEANRLKSTPLELGSCTGIRDLNLAKNSLTDLTPTIGSLRQLTSLNLSGNAIRELPLSIGFLPLLSKLGIADLDLVVPPAAVTGTGEAGVRAYMRDLAASSEELWRVKVMVMGQENVGKTSLLRCLRKKMKTSKQYDIDTIATDGIQVDNWELQLGPSAEEKFNTSTVKGSSRRSNNASPPPTAHNTSARNSRSSVTLSTWDFAGQDVYYATHQLFISERSVFLLVWNISKPESNQRLAYWVHTIIAASPRSPIILVGTHADGSVCSDAYVSKTLTEVEAKIRGMTTQLHVARVVSCANGRGIDELRQDIETLVMSQARIGERIPSSYFELERFALSQRKTRQPPTLPFSAWCLAAKSCGIEDQQSLTAATALLHSLGSICHFKQLDDVIVLDPQWLTEVIASVFSLKNTFCRNGTLNAGSLAHLWKDESKFPTSLHPYLIQLLERFELVFRKNASDGDLLAPDLLPDDMPTLSVVWPYTWHCGAAPASAAAVVVNRRAYVVSDDAAGTLLGRRYELPYVPRGLMGRFMTRMLRFTTPMLLWRNGFVVERNEARLFTKLYGDAGIELYAHSATGAPGARLLNQASEQLSAMVLQFYKLTYKLHFVCTVCLAQKALPNDVGTFAYSPVAEALLRGDSHLQCRGNKHSVPVDQLAPDLVLGNRAPLDLSEMKLQERPLGEGSYAIVLGGTLKGKPVAVKTLRITASAIRSRGERAMTEAPDNLEESLESFHHELAILSRLKHSNVVALVGHTTRPLCIVTELLEAGTLFDLLTAAWLHESVDLSWHERTTLAFQLASAVAYLHSRTPPVLHRDIKSPNVLLTHDPSSGQLCAKLADFGTAIELSAQTTLGRTVDNPTWLAPEILQGKDYAEPSDVYGMGVVFWELSSREEYLGNVRLWYAKEELILSGKRPEIPYDTPVFFRDLITQCLRHEPSERPTAAATVKILQQKQLVSDLCKLSA